MRMNENNGEQKGLWTFSGWTKDPTIQTNYGDDVITKTITYKGTWTFEAKPVTNYKVAYADPTQQQSEAKAIIDKKEIHFSVASGKMDGTTIIH